MSNSQIAAIVILTVIGIICLFVGMCAMSDGYRKVGIPFLLVGTIHISPAVVNLWIKAVGG